VREVVRGVWVLEGLKMGRSYVVEHDDGLTLIDTSSPGAANRILDAIKRIGRRPEHLRTIVVTHYHYDHTGNVNELRERTGATVIAHPDDAPYIEGRKPWGTARPQSAIERIVERMTAPNPFSVVVDAAALDNQVLSGGLRVLHAPGHTPGHVAVLDQRRRVLFAGDAFMNVFGLHVPTGGSTHDMAQARRTIRELSKLDFDHALPGHGNPILNQAAEKLRMWTDRWLRQPA